MEKLPERGESIRGKMAKPFLYLGALTLIIGGGVALEQTDVPSNFMHSFAGTIRNVMEGDGTADDGSFTGSY